MKTNLKEIAVVVVLFISMSSFLNFSDLEQQDSKSNRLLPEKLCGIDVGIQGWHFPNPTYAVLEDNMYVWKHDTSVTATSEDLQVIEYGSYVYTDAGWYLRVTYTPEDFEKTYHCKNALLKKGKTYTDPTSWRRSEKLFGGDALWFYLAKNKAGKVFKGTALIETEAKLVPEKQSEVSKKITFDTKKSVVKWTGYGEVGNYSLTGAVTLKSGYLETQNSKITSGIITIDLTRITHPDNHLKEHLKSEDFFDVKKYPKATFIITSSKTLSSTEIELVGNLTIKKTTKPITIKMTQNKTAFSGKITLDRTAFGVQYGSKSFFDNLGDQAIKNEFDLEFILISK